MMKQKCAISSETAKNCIIRSDGVLTYDILKRLLTELENCLKGSERNRKTIRKVMNVAIEAFFNVYNHARNDSIQFKSSVAVYSEDHAYRITTVNPVSKTQLELVKRKLAELLSLNRKELDETFLTALNTGVCRPSGAGLGFLDMARRSNQEMDYRLVHYDHSQCFQLDIRIIK